MLFVVAIACISLNACVAADSDLNGAIDNSTLDLNLVNSTGFDSVSKVELSCADLNSDSNINDLKSNSNSVFNITEKNYHNYFDSNGKLNNSLVSNNDTINLSGNFTNKSFIINKYLKITSFDQDAYLYNCQILFNGVKNKDSKYTVSISNLNMESNVNKKSQILINSSSNIAVYDNVFFTSGYHSYPIAIETSNLTRIYNNTIRTIVSDKYNWNSSQSSENSSWQHSGITLRGSFNNSIIDNHITVEDSYGIYLCFPESNYNLIANNTILCSVEKPSFWGYGIYVTGINNQIYDNSIIGMFRGIYTSKGYNQIVGNKIYNVDGVDLQNPSVKGGDYAIYASSNSVVANNSIFNSNVFKAGILVGANSEVYGNYIEITSNSSGLRIGAEENGSNSKVYNNTVYFLNGNGITVDGNPKNVYIANNTLISLIETGASSGSGSGVGINVKYQSKSKRPYNLTVLNNTVITSGECAIDISQASIDLWVCKDNNVSGKLIIYPKDSSYVPGTGGGKVYNVNNKNFNEFFNEDGTLSSKVKDYDTLIFKGNFSLKSNKLIISKILTLVGSNAKFINTTICVYSPNCTIKNITIVNNDKSKQNLWGIYVCGVDNVKILNNKISVWDKNTSYAIYICDSKRNTVANNVLKSQGNNLVFTLLCYEVHNSKFQNNTIRTVGTGELYPYYDSICIDGEHSINELSKTYGVIFDYSSNNTFDKNKVNVTSSVKGFQIAYKPSVNILYGLYLYYDSDYNKITNNVIWVQGHDPFLYGLGCSGDDTGKGVTTADYNVFKKNKITVKGDYFANGIILRTGSLHTILEGNKLTLRAINYTYGVNLEICGYTTIKNNAINSSAKGNYGIELYSSWGNNIKANTIASNASYTESIGAYASSGNNFTDNYMVSWGDAKHKPGQGPEHPDSVKLQNVAMWFESGSTDNLISNNIIRTNAKYAIKFASGSTGNTVSGNKLYARSKGGNAVVSDAVGGNNVHSNSGTSINGNGNYEGNGSSNIDIEDPIYRNGSSDISGSSNSNGASALGAVDYNLQANALSDADSGSGDSGSSGSASELISKSAYSQYTIPLIVLFVIGLFCYSFLSNKNSDDE